MTQTLEKRVERLERELADLAARFAGRRSRKTDWKRTFGLSQDDGGFQEMMRLGRVYRRSLKGNGADS